MICIRVKVDVLLRNACALFYQFSTIQNNPNNMKRLLLAPGVNSV